MDINITFEMLFSLAYEKTKKNVENKTTWYPFAYRGKQCLLAMYSYGDSNPDYSRRFWPCLYIETDKHGHEYQFRSTPNIHGGITFGVQTIPASGLIMSFVGCDLNHSCDRDNTPEEDLEILLRSLQGLYVFTTTPDHVLYPNEKEDDDE